MSTNTIDNHLITQFSDRVHMAAQQINSRLKAHVLMKQMIGDDFAYDGLGVVEDREVVSRITPTIFDDIDSNRRKIRRRRFVVTLPIDASDVRAQLLDPQSNYVTASVRAKARRFDRIGVEAAHADVLTGRNFGTTVTFASDGGNTVNATAGVTYETLLAVNKFWTNNEVGTDLPEDFLLLLTGTEIEALMQEVELTSGDFTKQFAVDKGKLTVAVGLILMPYGADVPNPILAVAGGTRDCVAMAGRGLCYGISKEMKIKIQERPDFVETTQVQVISEMGAVRTEGLLVQKYQTTA